jgi:hypothetical protein
MKPIVFLAGVLLTLSATASQAATNLVVNGDFSQGNTGFTTGYTYVAPRSGAMMPETVYTIAADPRAVHPYWVGLGDDNARLIVNGATHAGVTVWQESLATTTGQAYQFSASAADVCCNGDHPGHYAASELEFQVSTDGFATFQTLATINTTPPGDAGQFQTATADFTAAGAVQIRIIDALTGRVGNDFAIDDISVVALTAGSVGGKDPGPGITAGPVPEPGIWALMIIGFGGVGGAMRARRRALVLRFAQ